MNKELLEHLKTYLQLHHDQGDGGVHINLIARINEELAKPEPEPNPDPICYLNALHYDGVVWFEQCEHDDKNAFPVYTHPPANREPVLLSDYEVRKAADAAGTWTGYSFARAIERRVRGE